MNNVMQPNAKLVSWQEVQTLIAAGSATNCELRGVPGGVIVIVLSGRVEFVLRTQRGRVRVFRTIDAAATLMQSEGVRRMELDLRQWDPRQAAL